MQTFRRFLLLLVSALALVSCTVFPINLPFASPSATPVPPTDTPVPSPTDTAIPTATNSPEPTFTAIPSATATATVPPGTQVTFGNVSLFLPTPLGSGTTNSTVTDVEFPYFNPSSGDMPEHSKLVLNDYPIQGAVLEPQVLVFPASDYAGYTDLTAQIITTLRDVPYLDGQPLPPGLPAGPFNAHVGAVTFANGHGIRYLTQFDQAPLPANNREMFYYFHGLTNNGTAYVEAIFPVQAAYLAADEDPNAPVPAGGVPFTSNDLGGYFQAISDKLNATPPDQFTPSLTTLDALLQSISIK